MEAKFMAVLREIDAHTARLGRDAKLQNATGARVMQEIGETVMPLLRDFARSVATEVHGLTEYVQSEIEPLLREAAGAADSMLRPADAELITTRLLGYRSALEGSKDRAVGDEKQTIETELAEIDRALARVAEITSEEDPEEDDDDDDDEPADGVEQ
jgi:hypothetical protein